ncbi:DUF2345 domain-containing protein, partial [Shigella boydii]|uniref:DUF2345 domain-containing protein n=1 Tax=Shigella boydii TaxID=621 RepID=UPI000E5C87EE
RTDLWGAVRAKKGIFISADAQDKAQGQVREMADIISELNGLSDKIQKLSDDATTANADPADMAAQIALITSRINDLTASVILMHAPKGVAVASGEHLQLAAVKNLQINAGNNAGIGVVKNMFIGVGRALSVFVRKAGIKLIANKGAVSVQAQHDLMELLAKKSIEIVSTEDEIKITAKKKITINGGGSYIQLDACGIEPGTPGDYNVKAVHYSRQPGGKLKQEMMAFPVISAKFDEQVRVIDDDGNFMANVPYYIEDSIGNIYKGFTDSVGCCERIFTEESDNLKVLLGIKALGKW